MVSHELISTADKATRVVITDSALDSLVLHRPELDTGARRLEDVIGRLRKGELECRVLVTRRLRPLTLGAQTVHQIGLPYHWGAIGRVRGAAANELFPLVADPNVNIPESKVITADLVPGRRKRRRTAAVDGAAARAGHAPQPREARAPGAVRRRDRSGVGPHDEPPQVEPDRHPEQR